VRLGRGPVQRRGHPAQLAIERRHLAAQPGDVGAGGQVHEVPDRPGPRLDAAADAGLHARREAEAAEERPAPHDLLEARRDRALGGVEDLPGERLLGGHAGTLPAARPAQTGVATGAPGDGPGSRPRLR
jgi:hypothetical protein